ncbi:Uncharacterised protein [Mycobacterium tuberculosis]|uniref:Uncharacterized protein n=1 Tax=Mycobacterium tuberculosis TaxID=1773 RepID=A0A916LA21_MYCTX|nr:Uncharacterised protein [Mycobacterium tuberculosis]CKT21083.1 Uncharacterised protein [Mycobacterium tuberculosis]COW26588.1 Uncharacterised protein [Mycobacterium tuberculosis]COW48194.1 Uncharacterised protein [Mycobacterium tuberculosis]COX56907.1 Uncharacterised protein [Mycobacterium tuberculosis]
MEAIAELRAVVLHGDLIDRHPLLFATVLQLAAHLLAAGDGVRVGVELTGESGPPQGGEVLVVDGLPVSIQEQRPDDTGSHQPEKRHHARKRPPQSTVPRTHPPRHR